MEKINCPICDTNNFDLILKGNDTLHNIKGEFEVVRCVRCGLMLTNPRPSLNEIKKYYPDDYAPYGADFKRAKEVAKLRKKYKWFFGIIDPKMTLDLNTNQENASVLEIGCGAGNFLYELQSLHPRWNIKGTDFSEKIIDNLKRCNLDVFVSDLTALNLASESVDIVYGWMIMEHIHSINKALSEIHRVLRDDGKFSFSIPNAGSWEFNFFGKNWFALQLPSHLYHFTESTISKILEKNGFEVEKIIHQKSVTNIFLSLRIIVEKSFLPKSVKFFLNRMLEWNIIYFILTLPLASILAFIGQSGRLTIIASKKV
ncbi:MAG: methyltransferase domain-containing protein [Parcubacteria group bacterium]|jgi:SAM-dependent methyltransferase